MNLKKSWLKGKRKQKKEQKKKEKGKEKTKTCGRERIWIEPSNLKKRRKKT